jgi:hypothetical protein
VVRAENTIQDYTAIQGAAIEYHNLGFGAVVGEDCTFGLLS